jgi:G3E family GTPase
MEPDAPPIPINVITGFLGSGKTTLLRQLLASPELGDTAVLINEFGEVGLDHYLLEKVDERTVMLQSGCICCTIREDLGTSTPELYTRRERGEIPPFERLVIETSGLADPVPILYTLMTEPVVSSHFQVGNVVTTVDAVNGALHLARQPESAKQAAVADRIVLTKTDIAEPDAVRELDERLKRLNPTARRLHGPSGNLNPNNLLAGRTYDPRSKPSEVRDWLDEEAYRADADHHHDANRHDVNRHDARIQAFCLTFDAPIDWGAFAIWLTMLLHSRGEDVLRVKGLLRIEGSEGPVVIHGVQHIIHPPIHLDAWPDDDRRSKIVFILRDIERDEIEASLAAFNQLGKGEETAAAIVSARPSVGTQVGGRPIRRPGGPAWLK